MLKNLNNYGPYVELITNGKIVINPANITIENYNEYFIGLLNILRDSIEDQQTHKYFITIEFESDSIELSIMDYYFNIIMWYLLVRTKTRIEPKHIFFDNAITKNTIKRYIDDYFINENRTKFSNIELNNIIDDTLNMYMFIDEFSFYLSNTINLEDNIELMNKHPEFYDIIHADLSKVPIEDVKNIGMELTEKAVNYIKNSDHCLADSFKAGEGINIKQYREFSINIGSKPDGQRGVFPAIINSNYLTSGVGDPLSYFIDSSGGRTAQILQKMNVGSSGHFARLLGLNSMDTIMHPDPHYVCDSKNFEIITIENQRMLNMLDNRYYRLSENGMEYLLKSKECKHLIGKTIYLRSPMTCASHARGHGVCYRCYGDLAHTNNDINIGKFAAEALSSILTQILLSAKHLLESLVEKIEWSNGFLDIFEVDGNIVKLQDEMNYKGYKLLIDPNEISLEDELDNFEFNEYVNGFEVEFPDGRIIKCNTTTADNLYISLELNDIIRKYGEPTEGKISINMNELKNFDIFLIMISNNELSRTLNKLKNIIDKNDVTKSMDKNQILQAMLETVIDGNLSINAVHCEIILSNQLRKPDAILEKPDWEYPNEPYEILTLNQALIDNPSITISLSYQNLSKALYNPLTFKKNGVSFMDLFFIETPAKYLNSKDIISTKNDIEKPNVPKRIFDYGKE